mgnify:CR=1 FL=1
MTFFKKISRFAKVGSFLGIRQIKRGSIWINLLIISIMTLTFLSLVVIPGILVGLTEGSFEQNREYLTGDVYLTTLPDEEAIVNTQDIIRVLDTLPEVQDYSVRFKIGSTVESGYLYRDDFSEEVVMKKVLDEIFHWKYFVKRQEAATRDSEPDYYVRHNNKIYLFENKDILVRADIKSSSELEKDKKDFLFIFFK